MFRCIYFFLLFELISYINGLSLATTQNVYLQSTDAGKYVFHPNGAGDYFYLGYRDEPTLNTGYIQVYKFTSGTYSALSPVINLNDFGGFVTGGCENQFLVYSPEWNPSTFIARTISGDTVSSWGTQTISHNLNWPLIRYPFLFSNDCSIMLHVSSSGRMERWSTSGSWTKLGSTAGDLTSGDADFPAAFSQSGLYAAYCQTNVVCYIRDYTTSNTPTLITLTKPTSGSNTLWGKSCAISNDGTLYVSDETKIFRYNIDGSLHSSSTSGVSFIGIQMMVKNNKLWGMGTTISRDLSTFSSIDTVPSVPASATRMVALSDYNMMFISSGNRATSVVAYFTPPTTPAPSTTKSPTKEPTTKNPTLAPTQGCVVSSTCPTNQFCNSAYVCVNQLTCTNTADCNDLLSGRVPRCEEGKCIDKYAGTCDWGTDCEIKSNLLFIDENSLGLSSKTFKTSDNTERLNAVKDTVDEMKVNLQNPSSLGFVFTGSDKVIIDARLFTLYNNNADILTKMKLLVCGTSVKQCNIQLDTSSNSGRLLREFGRELSAGIFYSVTLSYVLDESALNNLDGTVFTNPAFVSQLAALLPGISTQNISLIYINGEMKVDVHVVVENVESETPLSPVIMSQLQSFQTQFTNITSLISTTLGWQSSDIISAAINLCGDRDCSGLGVNKCSKSTGICDCSGTNYWGINCETLCSCQSGGSCSKQYCTCEFPDYGQRCENQVAF